MRGEADGAPGLRSNVMTRQSTFKKRIRERMQKTGERYAAARLALLGAARQSPPPEALSGYPDQAPLLTDLGPLSSALAQAGIRDPATGEPFTETRLFGLSGGPGFMSFVFQYQGHPPLLTFTCRSFSLPGPVIERALTHAGIGAQSEQTGSARKAAASLTGALDGGRVALVSVDQARLPWLAVPEAWAGQWPRFVNVVGKDADGDYAIHDQAMWSMTADALAEARGGYRKAKHHLFAFPDASVECDPVAATKAALTFAARNQREAPFAGFANNFGLAGLKRTAERMGERRRKEGWAKVFATGPHAFTALWRTWECLHVELTAPAGGRPLYARFLEDAASLTDLQGLQGVAGLVQASAEAFEAWSDAAVSAGGELLDEAISITERIDEALRSGEEDTPDRVRALRAERERLADACTLDQAERQAAFDALAAAVEQVHACEVAWVEAVETVVR